MNAQIPALILKKEARRCCVNSERFLVFTEGLVAQAANLAGQDQETANVAINQAKVVLVDRFYAERQASPLDHQDRVSGEHGTLCVYGVFLHGLARLIDLQLQEAPPPLAVKPPARVIVSQPISPPEPAGLWFATSENE